ncbi:MAG: peptidyl-prolyl cis-trans isomerase [Elusimicrobia bacterium]|nr:peptidyl-prolyl cis-trans isomerase [Elusimicrobiota bacterium]
MKHAAWACAAAILLAGPAGAEPDREVVSVNGTVIRQAEIVDRLWKRYGPATLDEMVDEILLRQAAQAKGIKAEPAEVEQRLSRVREQFSDPAIFESQLKQSGGSVEKLKVEIADQLVLRKLIVATQKLSVSDAELRKAFQENREKLATPPAVHLRHILVKTEAEADALVAKIKGGADFKALARTSSLAPTGKLTGGDYGFVSRGMLPEEIDAIAFAMKPGELRVVASAKGRHVLQVVKTRAAQPARFETAKEDLRDMLLEEKMKSVLPAYLAQLRRQADIKPLGAPEP